MLILTSLKMKALNGKPSVTRLIENKKSLMILLKATGIRCVKMYNSNVTFLRCYSTNIQIFKLTTWDIPSVSIETPYIVSAPETR